MCEGHIGVLFTVVLVLVGIVGQSVRFEDLKGVWAIKEGHIVTLFDLAFFVLDGPEVRAADLVPLGGG